MSYNLQKLKALHTPLDCFLLKELKVKSKGGSIQIKWEETQYDRDVDEDGKENINPNNHWLELKQAEFPLANTAQIFELLDKLKGFVPYTNNLSEYSLFERLDSINILKVKFICMDRTDKQYKLNIESKQSGKNPVGTGDCDINALVQTDEQYVQLENLITDLEYYCYQRAVCGVLLKTESKNVDVSTGEINLE